VWAKTATGRPIHFMFDSNVAGIFGDGGSNGSISGLKKIQDGGRCHLGKISNGHISTSATGRTLDFMFVSKVVFRGRRN